MKPFIIGEIGINHNGNLQIAKKLIDMAADCGVDAVKFQKRDIDTVYTQEFLDSPRESPWGTTQREQKQGLEFGQYEYDAINEYCISRGILWFASAWDIKSQEFLRQYNLPYNKIASAMITHKPLLHTVASENKHTFISTGMSTEKEISDAVDIFNDNGCDFTLLHTTSLYPCPDELCNLSRINWLAKTFNCPVGYSGHELGLTPTLLAVSMGCDVIERHITLDRASYGSDQSASLEKRGLEVLVREARLIDKMINSNIEKIQVEETKIAKKLRYWKEVSCLKG